tara:strand:- start:69 stop:374 length:306 start_codon:yes stop_codon:yes gene_type:complete
MRRIDNLMRDTGSNIIKFFFTIIILLPMLSCNTGASISDCTDCGGGLVDGYLYKKVTINDLADLTQINVSANIDQCIRFMMDGEDFSSATIVEECCCTIYN